MARTRCTGPAPETLPARELTPEELARWRVYADSAEGQLFLSALRPPAPAAARRDLAQKAAAEAAQTQNSAPGAAAETARRRA
jgi:hypothetical protein